MSKELIDRLKSYIPSGDGHNSQYANDLADAVAILEAKAAPAGERDSHWFSLVMNCAAELETASYYMTDESAKRIAQSGADYYRKQAGAAHQCQQAREVVMPGRKELPDLLLATYHENRGWNACLDEFARLNKGAGSHE